MIRPQHPSIFPPRVWEGAMHHAMATPDVETCGLVIDGAFHVAQNVAAHPETEFEISDAALREAMQRGAIEGVIHSHVDGQDYPSREDMASQIAMDLPWGVVVIRDRRMREIFEWGDHLLDAPLVGRRWKPAVFDCFALMRSHVYQTTGLKLPDVVRSDDWWETDTEALLRDELRRFPQVKVLPAERVTLREGDILLMALRGPQINHFAAYIGHNLVLHHDSNGVSSRRALNSLSAKVRYVLRIET